MAEPQKPQNNRMKIEDCHEHSNMSQQASQQPQQGRVQGQSRKSSWNSVSPPNPIPPIAASLEAGNKTPPAKRMLFRYQLGDTNEVRETLQSRLPRMRQQKSPFQIQPNVSSLSSHFKLPISSMISVCGVRSMIPDPNDKKTSKSRFPAPNPYSNLQSASLRKANRQNTQFDGSSQKFSSLAQLTTLSSPLNYDRKMELRRPKGKKGLANIALLVKNILMDCPHLTYKNVSDQILNLEDAHSQPTLRESKNIRRRVYDALNVLIAVGILAKVNRYVCSNYHTWFHGRCLTYTWTEFAHKQTIVQELKEFCRKKQLKLNKMKRAYDAMVALRKQNEATFSSLPSAPNNRAQWSPMGTRTNKIPIPAYTYEMTVPVMEPPMGKSQTIPFPFLILFSGHTDPQITLTMAKTSHDKTIRFSGESLEMLGDIDVLEEGQLHKHGQQDISDMFQELEVYQTFLLRSYEEKLANLRAIYQLKQEQGLMEVLRLYGYQTNKKQFFFQQPKVEQDRNFRENSIPIFRQQEAGQDALNDVFQFVKKEISQGGDSKLILDKDERDEVSAMDGLPNYEKSAKLTFPSTKDSQASSRKVKSATVFNHPKMLKDRKQSPTSNRFQNLNYAQQNQGQVRKLSRSQSKQTRGIKMQ